MPLALLFSGAEKSGSEAWRESSRMGAKPGMKLDVKQGDKHGEKLHGLPGLRLVKPAGSVSESTPNRQVKAARKSGGILSGLWRTGHERTNSELAARHLVRPAARSIEPQVNCMQVSCLKDKRRPRGKSGISGTLLGSGLKAVEGRRSYVAEYLKRKGVLEQFEAKPEFLETPGVEASRRKGLVETILNSVTPEEARRSLSYLDRLYSYFALVSDIPGQQKTLLLALAARNRARRSGMSNEAELFDSWLEANS